MNIVDSDFAYLNERLAVHYGVEGVKGLTLRPVAIKPEHRLGRLADTWLGPDWKLHRLGTAPDLPCGVAP